VLAVAFATVSPCKLSFMSKLKPLLLIPLAAIIYR
jgi:hypothetical protein